MTSVSDNVFEMLSEERDASNSADLKLEKDIIESNISSSDEKPSTPVGDESSWTSVQSSSAKTRRLAPQYSISRQDIGVDSPRNRAAQQEVVKNKGNECSHPIVGIISCLVASLFIGSNSIHERGFNKLEATVQSTS